MIRGGMAGSDASSGSGSLPTPAFATSGSDSYTLLLFALLVEPTNGLGARWVSLFMSRRCHLSHDLRHHPVGVLGLDPDHWRSHRTLGFPQFRGSLFECRSSPHRRSCFTSDLPADCLDCLSRLPLLGSRERLINFTCHPQLVQQYRQLSRHRHDGPLFGLLFPSRLDPQAKLL
jgi:hypothetical protein